MNKVILVLLALTIYSSSFAGEYVARFALDKNSIKFIDENYYDDYIVGEDEEFPLTDLKKCAQTVITFNKIAANKGYEHYSFKNAYLDKKINPITGVSRNYCMIDSFVDKSKVVDCENYEYWNDDFYDSSAGYRMPTQIIHRYYNSCADTNGFSLAFNNIQTYATQYLRSVNLPSYIEGSTGYEGMQIAEPGFIMVNGLEQVHIDKIVEIINANKSIYDISYGSAVYD